MHLTLIGMSNIGKSRWSRKLAGEHGFRRVDCDDAVEKNLAAYLVQQGYAGIHDVARWMGQPYDPRYADTSGHYLDAERDVMQAVLRDLDKADKPVVVDTTGSVIYTGDEIVGRLKQRTRVVYLEASAAHAANLFQRYKANPKPVIWGDAYQPLPHETPEQVLQRCYPMLLAYRADRYRAMADDVVPFDQHMNPGFDVMKLIGAAS